MDRKLIRNGLVLLMILGGFAVSGPGCQHEERGPTLSGGREVKAWIEDLRDPKPQVRRQAVLKLGNVGDADPTALDGLAQALNDSDALVRHDAVLAVVKFRQAGKPIKAKIETMSRSDKDARVRDVSQRALARLDSM
jgi:HEAT repeat protein